MESWKKPSLLVSQPAPPRGPNCWVPVYHGVSGGRPRWAADSRLTQGPRIVLTPNALFFWDTQHDKHTENTERFMMIRVGQVYWNQIIYTRPFLFGLSIDSVTDQIRRDLPQYVMKMCFWLQRLCWGWCRCWRWSCRWWTGGETYSISTLGNLSKTF